MQVNLELKTIYAQLCPDCKAKIVKLVQERLVDAQVREALEGDDKAEGGKN